MATVTLLHAGAAYPLEIEPEDDMDTLVLKVFSLTNVPPQEQRIFGLLPSGDPVLGSATTAAPPLSVTPGQHLALLVADALEGSEGERDRAVPNGAATARRRGQRGFEFPKQPRPSAATAPHQHAAGASRCRVKVAVVAVGPVTKYPLVWHHLA